LPGSREAPIHSEDAGSQQRRNLQVPVMLITGASRGLGLALVGTYAAQGWRVHACCRVPERAHALQAIRGEVEIHRLDVRDQTAYRPLADRLVEEPIDVLIANAGIPGPKDRIEMLDIPGWFETFHVNSIAPLVLAGAFHHHVARSTERKMIAISSILGSIGDNRSGGLYAYRCSKAALNMAWRSLSCELREEGVICTLVHPGWVRTSMGGEGAPLEPREAAAAIFTVIAGLDPAQNGRFLDYRGREIPW